MTTTLTKKLPATPVTDDVFEDLIPSPDGKTFELSGFGITNFSPHDIDMSDDDGTCCDETYWTVGGGTVLFLTKADLVRLRAALAKLEGA